MYLLCIVKNTSSILYRPNQTFFIKRKLLKESPVCSLLDYIILHGIIELSRTRTTATCSAATIISYAGPQVQKRSRKHLIQ
jgi:hypothetical protein